VIWDGPGPGDRVLLLAPHPDDETLSAGGLLQRVLARGGRAFVAFATDGENNPWTQRLVERRWRVGPEDCARFGRRRRDEALAALAELGVPAADAVFLGLPDQAITHLVLSGSETAVEEIASLITARRPTLLIAPSLFDLHPDHSALAVLVRLAAARVEPGRRPRHLSYLIHRSRGNTFAEAADGPATLRFDPSEKEKDRKRRAICRHTTQLAVHRRKFLSFADRPEIFISGEPATAGDGPHPVRLVGVGPDILRLEVELHPRLGAFGRPTLHLAGGAPGERRTFWLDLRWRRGRADVRDFGSGEITGRAALRGGRRGGIVEVPLQALPASRGLYVKLERRFGFFDEGGWLELKDPTRGDT
jgi:LmbE family N-acetylglucosaminyl deacetylase